jgi:hypothetical protein
MSDLFPNIETASIVDVVPVAMLLVVDPNNDVVVVVD